MDECRKQKHKDLWFYSRVCEERKGTLLNITLQGAMLLTDQPVEQGEEFNSLMGLPEDLAKKMRLRVRAASLWHQPNIKPKRSISNLIPLHLEKT